MLLSGCDSGGDKGETTEPGDDTVADVVAGPDTMADTTPLDTAEELPPPLDSVEEFVPMPDIESGEDTLIPEDTEPGPVEIPDSPAGAQLEWLLGVFSGENPYSADPVIEHISELLLGDSSPAGYVWKTKGTITYIGAVELLGFEEPYTTDYVLVAQVYMPNLDAYGHLPLRVEEAAPHKITSWSVLFAPELDPALGGPITAQEVGLFVYDPYFGGNVPGATVEAIDPTTGEGFEPPLEATTVEPYCWVRLALPEGVDQIALRVTHPDGFVTRSYGSGDAGQAGLFYPAFPPEALSDYLETLEIVETPGAGHFWGFLEWVEHDSYLAPPNPLVDHYVGCATVTFDPAGPEVLYSKPGTGLPDLEATSTYPDYATWWAYNVPPGAYTVTADAAGGSVDVQVPKIEPGGFTVLYNVFYKADFPTDPEGENCE